MLYDAIIVGARCAGSATALLLARQGYKVLLVDRAIFPSDTISGHFIFHPGVVRLQRWGLLDKLIASGCPPVTRISTNVGDFTLEGEVPLMDGAPAAIGPRRTVLDSLLLEAAAEAGAEIRQGFTVKDVLRDEERVSGIRGQGRDGSHFTEHARLVIGADGKHSRIAELVEAPKYREVPSLTCWYYSYWSNFPCDKLEMHWWHHHLILTFPTHDNQTFMTVAATQQEFPTFRSNIEGYFTRTIETIPDLAARMHDAQREDKFYGMADVPGFFRKPYGAGWALVGDAGHHKDPTPAYGISDAFCDAELLAKAFHSGMSGQQPLDDALASYHQQRDARTIPDYELTCQRARLEYWDNPDHLRLRAALLNNPEDTGQYFAAFAKAISQETFYNPQNLQRIIVQAQLSPAQG